MSDLVMGADQFLLTWNNHRSNFAEVFSQLRVQDQLVDVTLLCDGGSYPAHRLVLAACSPYFHQLFTRLPTQHPLVYLRDVRQAELEALLEFIYRGEVSVANSELGGLIKIAESLRIKGLGDVSQRDPGPTPSRPEKRTSNPYSPPSPSNPHTPRPRKIPRLSSLFNNNNSNTNNQNDSKSNENDSFASLLSPANSYGHALRAQAGTDQPHGFAQLMDNANTSGLPIKLERDSELQNSPINLIGESKLRSCLEGQEASLAGSQLSHLLVQPTASRVSAFQGSKKEDGKPSSSNRKKAQDTKSKSSSNPIVDSGILSSNENELKGSLEDVKQEFSSKDTDTDNHSPINSNQEGTNEAAENILLPNLQQLYEGERTTALVANYFHLLGLHQQKQQEQDQQTEDNHIPSAFNPLLTSTIQENQSSSNKDMKTCQLCGATIKHIANFRRHMKQHLYPRRFQCPWCSAAFGRKDNLKTHTRKHHPLEMEAQDQAGASAAAVVTTEPNRKGGVNGVEEEEEHDQEQEAEPEPSSPRDEIDDCTDRTADDSLVIAEDEEEVEPDAEGGGASGNEADEGGVSEENA